MAGAPQGPVYQVAVLETGEFEPSPSAEEEMRAVRAASEGGGDWADLYSAVDSARRLCIFHPEVVMLGGGGNGNGDGEQEGGEEEGGGEGGGGSGGSNLEGVVGLLTMAVGNLRSSMVRNALLGVGDIFRSVSLFIYFFFFVVQVVVRVVEEVSPADERGAWCSEWRESIYTYMMCWCIPLGPLHETG